MVKHMTWKLSFCTLLTLSAMQNVFADGKQLVELSDTEMSEVNGQALMSLSYLAPTDAKNPMKNITGSNNIGFYKLGMEAELELNANIKNLQLGCGGVNGAGACDIDIKNLALSGLPSSYDANGVPVYANGRAVTSGKLTNPFMEFAISNPDSASTREIKGLRFSAEKINALLSAGVENGTTPSTTDGIQRLSGFMQIASTSGTAYTQQTKFGLTQNQKLSGYAHLCAGIIGGCSLYNRDIHFESIPNDPKSTGITIPSVSTNFVLPSFSINGSRMQTAEIQNIKTALASIPIAANGNPLYPASMFANDQLRVSLDCNGVSGGGGLIPCSGLTILKDGATFKMGQGSEISNLNLNIDFSQSLSMFHNIPLTGTGGYLSLQSIALLWPGATVSAGDVGKTSLSQMGGDTDVAQKGWWMSFADPVQLGKLNVTQPIILDDAILSQVASRVTTALGVNNPDKPYAGAEDLGKLLSLLADNPLTSKITADLNTYTQANPVYFKLQNQQLANQKVISNCYGSLKFC